MTPFALRVAEVVAATRAGDLLTYAEVAEEAGAPGAARAVGRALAASDGIPWWRIVTSRGRLVPGREPDHARRLIAEGHAVVDGHVVPHNAHQVR